MRVLCTGSILSLRPCARLVMGWIVMGPGVRQRHHGAAKREPRYLACAYTPLTCLSFDCASWTTAARKAGTAG